MEYTIHQMERIENYYDLNGTLVETNEEIPPVYVVRCNLTSDQDYETWEDQEIFDTLEEAKKCIKELEKGE